MRQTGMRLSGSFVLPQDAQLQPAAELSQELRRSSGADDGDFALSRKNSRSHSKIVDAEAARLLRHFDKPSTIAQAVARFIRSQPAGANRQEPEIVLEEALPLLRSLIGEGLLVEAGSPQASPTVESLATGDRVDEWLVARCIQSLEDTELYLVSNSAGQWGALKIGRLADFTAKQALEHEAKLLTENLSHSLPHLLAASTWSDRPYLVTEWFPGVDAETAASEIRDPARQSGAETRQHLHALGNAVLNAYTELHSLGLLHGDIHPRNLLVDRHVSVKILDFGLASRLGESALRGGGVSFYLEPEFARAALADIHPPPTDFASEQYAIAALLYLLLTGAHTQDFNLERREMLTQIATGAVVPFVKRGIEPWPEVEQVLAKALSKNPTERYASTREFADAWRNIDLPQASPQKTAKDISRLGEIRSKFLRNAAIGGEWWRDAFHIGATVPINNGAAGLAFALHRIASATGDGELHATADAWSVRAIREIDSAKAFESETADPGALKPGLASLYHHRSGVYAAQALIGSARENIYLLNRAATQFTAWGREALDEPDPPIDLTLGFAGSLLGSALLLDSFAEPGLPKETLQIKAELLAFGHELSARLSAALDRFAPIGESLGLDDTGVAHGWAGILYAALQWHAAAGEATPTALLTRLDQLAARAEPAGRGLHWPWGTRVSYPSWCNGSAGQLFLWITAHKATGESRYLNLAEGAAWNTWETPSRYPWLCCGLTGQAYALLNFHRHTGDDVWLYRAIQMAQLAAESAAASSAQTGDSPSETRPGSLYNGIAGLAVLTADLECPLYARMPFFERE